MQVKKALEECEELKKNLTACRHQRDALEKKQQSVQNKLNKTQVELEEERAMNNLLRSDQAKWSKKITELEERSANEQKNHTIREKDLEEQIRDLMMHIEAQNKIQNALETQEVTEQEVAESTLAVAEPRQTPARTRRHRRK
ncbi:unnamed protein product [Gongylonema pulchrum]|uniref:Myosin_tail_1 domain-containing protein n=1 Tax=Gongylonema pulchrum TaxID=637853 RepID=A0A183D4Y5_9BILA|nr:unnamed protein product [Gongylonema pulchrum]